MTSDYAESTDTESTDTESTDTSASRRAGRENMADLFALCLGHFCVKMLWHSLYTTALRMDADPWDWICVIANVFLTSVDLLVFFYSILTQSFIVADYDLCHLVCGAMFTVAYNLCFLRYATTGEQVSAISNWLTFVFNFGCLVEVKLGLVEKCVYALADM